MNKTIEKKLLHFFTGGNIFEDFAASRTKKVAKLRRVIRACFYVHFAAAVICIALAVIFRAGAGIIAVSVCEVVLIGLAFLAVGDMTLMKTLLCCADTAFAAAMFVTGALVSNKTPFFAVAGVSVVTTIVAFCAYFAASFKEFLEGYSPLAVRREHYTLLPQLASDSSPDGIFTTGSKEPAVKLPPPKTEFQMLADKLKDILCTPKTDAVTESAPAGIRSKAPAAPPESEYDAPIIPENPVHTEVSQ